MEKNERVRRPRFSLVLKTNGDDSIIIERFFNIKDFNPESIHSIDISYVCDWARDSIGDVLKRQSMKMLWNSYDEYSDEPVTRTFEKTDKKLCLELRYGRTLINTRLLDVSMYPKEVTDNIYLKEDFPFYIQEISNVLQMQTKDLTRSYSKTKLFVFSKNIKTDYTKIKQTINSFRND
jgi:hypothetical protein